MLHVKEPYEHDRYSSAKFSCYVSHPRFICFTTSCLLALLTDVSSGRIRMTRSRLIVRLVTSHHTYLIITKTHKGRPRPGPGCSATDDYDESSVTFLLRLLSPSSSLVWLKTSASVCMYTMYVYYAISFTADTISCYLIPCNPVFQFSSTSLDAAIACSTPFAPRIL
jgi:hypothetical protein